MTDNPYSEPGSPDTVSQPRNIFLYGCGGVIAIIAFAMLLLVLLMPFSRGREPAYRTQCKNNLKQIGLALHNYHDEHGVFPPAFTVDENGKRLHSWRTLILPYLEQKALYSSIDLSKPWDDPANRTAYETNIETYRCPSADVAPSHATYLGLVGPDLFFNSSEPRNIRAITDGTANTLMVVEVAQHQSVHWMSPQDADEESLLSIGEETEFSHMGGFQAALADGSVRFLSKNIATETLSALTTVAGHEAIGEY
jgi:hypothetical protein